MVPRNKKNLKVIQAIFGKEKENDRNLYIDFY